MVKKLISIAMVALMALIVLACDGGKELRKQIEELRSRLEQQEEKLEGADSENAKLEEKQKRLEEEMKRQEERYNELLTENSGKITDLNKELEETRKQLEEYREQAEYYNMLSQFDLSDPKEVWDGKIIDDSDNLFYVVSISLLVTFKKTATYPIVEEKFFQLEGLARLVYPGIAYIYESPNLFESGYWESHDKEEFRQAAWLVFESNGNFESYIRHLEKLEFVKSVKPLYYPEIYLDRETYDKYDKLVNIEYYLGTYNGYVVLLLRPMTIPHPILEVIGGIKFYSAIELYREREYIYLSDAYKDGLVNAEDVFKILYHFRVRSLLQYPNVMD